MKNKIVIPESWNDLTPSQLRKVASLQHSNLKGVFFDYRVLIILLNVRWFQFLKQFKVIHIINNIAFSDLKKEYSWYYEKVGLTTFIPSLNLKREKFYSPSDRINNLTIDEFAHADDLYIGWLNFNKIEYLQMLAAVLYRENDEKGKRTNFDKQELTDRTKLFKKVDRKTLLAISLSYQGSRFHITHKFKYVFPKNKNKNVAFKLPKRSDFGKVIMHISGGKFGNYKDTKHTNVYTFLAEYDELLRLEKLRKK